VTGFQVGELAAVGTALLWTLSVLCWTAAGRYTGAMVVSFVRLVITCVLLSFYGWLVRGIAVPWDASRETWAILGLSGFLGFFLSDLFLFKAFLLIGPRLSLLIYSLTPPMATLMVWVGADQRLSAQGWLGMGVTLLGVAWVVAERPVPQEDRVQQYPWRGILYALLATCWQAAAAVLAKQGIGDYDAFAATYIRVLGGLVGLIPLITLRHRWPAVKAAMMHGRAMTIMLLGSTVGPFLGVAFYMIALRHCHAGVVTTIISTMPVLILPFSVLLFRERVSVRALLGAVLSIVGVALLVW
jgi:drug/metabolite transporter (DMT)-like permease